MSYRRAQRFVILSLGAIVSVGICTERTHGQSAQGACQPLVIKLSDTTTHYQPVLTGPPQTTSMEAGLVILLPGKSGPQHSSKEYEEALVILSGEGEMVISGGPTLKLTSNSVAYCPTQTEHYIRNTGTDQLKYVYVAAQAVK